MKEGKINTLENELEKSIEQALIKISENVEKYQEDFLTVTSKNNVYGRRGNEDCWTQSFFTGMIWLAYELTGEPKYLELASKHTDSFKYRLDNNLGLETHDIGFMYTLSSVADYKLTGSIKAKELGIAAADKLMERFKEKGEFIQAWGPNGDPDMYRLIIDCYMNLPLLYWASEVTGNKIYAEAATKHAHTARKVVIREDHSTFHTYYFDYNTGQPTKGVTAQGYLDDSCWSRGQAWGIYGMALCYRYTKDPVFIEEFIKITDYFINNLPEDKVAYWDLFFTQGDEERDSSAAAIAVSGIYEMLQFLPDKEYKKYKAIGDEIMISLIKNYTAYSLPDANGLLLHGVYSKPGNEESGNGINEMMIWGDYYFMEAMVRMTREWNSYW